MCVHSFTAVNNIAACERKFWKWICFRNELWNSLQYIQPEEKNGHCQWWQRKGKIPLEIWFIWMHTQAPILIYVFDEKLQCKFVANTNLCAFFIGMAWIDLFFQQCEQKKARKPTNNLLIILMAFSCRQTEKRKENSNDIFSSKKKKPKPVAGPTNFYLNLCVMIIWQKRKTHSLCIYKSFRVNEWKSGIECVCVCMLVWESTKKPTGCECVMKSENNTEIIPFHRSQCNVVSTTTHINTCAVCAVMEVHWPQTQLYSRQALPMRQSRAQNANIAWNFSTIVHL